MNCNYYKMCCSVYAIVTYAFKLLFYCLSSYVFLCVMSIVGWLVNAVYECIWKKVAMA
jgi:hypothetical protein